MSGPGDMPSPSSLAPADAPARRAWSVRRAFETFGPVIVLGLLVALVSIRNPKFLSPPNLVNILNNWSFVGIIAVGMTFVIILGGIDLSVGSLVAFAGGLGIWVMNTAIDAKAIIAMADAGAVRLLLARGFDALGMGGSEIGGVIVGLAVIVAAGAAAGLLNGVLITKGRVAAFIATLGGLAAYRSLAVALAEGGEFRSSSTELFKAIGNGGIPIGFITDAYGKPLVIFWPIVVFLAVAAAGMVTLRLTRFGRYVYAIGCNERAARYSAIGVHRVKIAAYTLLGGLTGLAALLNASRMNSVSSGNAALMWELDAIAAVVIGGTRMSGGTGSVWRTVVGLLMLGVIANMLNLLQVSNYLQGLVKGLIIVAAVLMQRTRRAE